MKKIIATETYGIEYNEKNFLCDCRDYNIENITFDEVCNILNNNQSDVLITVTHNYVDYKGQFVYNHPCVVSAKEFFTKIIYNIKLEYDEDQNYCQMLNRNIKVVELVE